MVTGGAGGLGEFIVRALAAKRAHVLVVDVDAEAAARVSDEIEGNAVVADLSSVHAAEPIMEATDGKVDVLVNCAGGWSHTGRNYPVAGGDEWEAVLRLNLLNPMTLLQQLREPLARSAIGACVSISSSAARAEGAYESPEYAVSKAGLIRLTSALADWPDRFGIRVACVVPGWIGLPRAQAKIAAMPVTDRPATVAPGEIAAEVVRLILDPDSGGQVVVMEAGQPPWTG